VQRGREAGIHVVAATQRPSAAILSGVLRANFPLRLVGRVVSTNDAQVAAGRGGTDAHLLRGRGDFLAVTGGDTAIRFQVAEIKARALREEVAALGGMGERRGRPALTQSRR
jgi:S-DNA-T family DNA segregation ATPase FtsK/SpoIIIE